MVAGAGNDEPKTPRAPCVDGARMNASALRYVSRADRNAELRQRTVASAQHHKRYGVGMIYLKLRQEGRLVNYKREERLNQGAKLQMRRRKRKKVPVGECQPLSDPWHPTRSGRWTSYSIARPRAASNA